MTSHAKILPWLALLAVCGCSSPAPPQNFAPLDYSYLPPIVLKVAVLNVVNAYVPTPGAATMIGQDPAPPGAALLTMLQHRLVPAGVPGTGTVTIETASVDQVGSNLTGTMTVDVSLSSPDGGATGYAEASVSASQTAPDPDAAQADVQAALYALSKQLMDNMNVQLQYQIQHDLGSWISWSAGPGGAAAGGAASGGDAIQSTPLGAPATGTAPLVPPGASSGAAPNYLPGAGPGAPAAPGAPATP